MTRQGPTSQPMRAGVMPDAADIASLVEQAADIAIHVDAGGIVAGVSVSADSPSLGCLDHWVGRAFSEVLNRESTDKFARRLEAMRQDPDMVPRPIELNHVDVDAWEFPVRYTLHRIAGSGALLMMGRDLQPIAEVQQRLVKEQMARERDQQKLRGETTFFRVVLEASATPLVLVEPQRGRIRDLNSAAATLLGSKVDTLTGTAFAQTFEGRRSGDLMDRLEAASGAEVVEGVEAVARRNGHGIVVYPDLFRAAGDVFMLCRLDAADAAGTDAADLSHALPALFAATSDAVVLADAGGTIRDANEAFLVLTDAAQIREVRGRSMADFLVRGGVDMKLIFDAVGETGSVRGYSAQIASINGMRAGVEISAARLGQKGGDLGVGLILREAAPRDLVGSDTGHLAVSDEAMKNIMDLVGTASLKELVSATSDVVEKICIETAVQLTGNNRVAAAEMLGLSRQSLYVKLHKHGLIGSDSDN